MAGRKCAGCKRSDVKLIQEGVRTFRCLACSRANMRKQGNAAHGRKMQTQYNLAPGEYKELLELQNGVCCVCGPWTGRAGVFRRLAVDHDHACCPAPPTCGRCTRGITCDFCNDLIGQLEAGGHAIARLQALMDYLTNPPAQPLLEEIRKKKTNERQYFGSEGIFGD